jgi:hypothetical protein
MLREHRSRPRPLAREPSPVIRASRLAVVIAEDLSKRKKASIPDAFKAQASELQSFTVPPDEHIATQLAARLLDIEDGRYTHKSVVQEVQRV